MSRDSAFISKITKDSFSTVNNVNDIKFSFSLADYAYKYQTAEQGFYSTLRKNFDFWLLVLYALECSTMDEYVTIIDDILEYDHTQSALITIGLEFFYQVLYERYLVPVFSYLGIEYDHLMRFKVIGKEGLIVCVSLYYE